MQDHRQAAGHGDNGTTQASSLCNPQPQAFSHDRLPLRLSNVCAAPYSIVRSIMSPDLEMPPS